MQFFDFFATKKKNPSTLNFLLLRQALYSSSTFFLWFTWLDISHLSTPLRREIAFACRYFGFFSPHRIQAVLPSTETCYWTKPVALWQCPMTTVAGHWHKFEYNCFASYASTLYEESPVYLFFPMKGWFPCCLPFWHLSRMGVLDHVHLPSCRLLWIVSSQKNGCFNMSQLPQYPFILTSCCTSRERRPGLRTEVLTCLNLTIAHTVRVWFKSDHRRDHSIRTKQGPTWPEAPWNTEWPWSSSFPPWLLRRRRLGLLEASSTTPQREALQNEFNASEMHWNLDSEIRMEISCH